MSKREDSEQLSIFEGPPATPAEIKAGMAIMNADALDESEFIVDYGKTYFCSFLINSETGQLAITTPGLVLLYSDFSWGRGLSGFKIIRGSAPPIIINYADIKGIIDGVSCEYRLIFQAGNMQINLRMRKPAEEELVKALAHADPDRWRAICEALNADHNKKPTKRARHRVARALIDKMLANCIPEHRQGALALLLKMPPSRRQNHANLLRLDIDTDLEKQALYQIPILILFPIWVSKYFAGKRQRDILDGLSLPRGARWICMQAVGPIIHILGMQRPREDAVPADLAWMTEKLCRAIHDNAPRMFSQRVVMNLICQTFLLSNRDAQLAESVGVWAAKATADLNVESECGSATAIKIAQWIVAEPELIGEAGVKPWQDKISLLVAKDNAENLRQYLMTRDAPEHELEITCPEFAETILKKLPGTEWRLIRIDSAVMMFSESKTRFQNCAFDLWLEACKRGTASIFVIRRPATKRDRAHRIHHCDVIGGEAVTDGMVRFHQDGRGRPFIGEALAQNNKPLKPALQEALQRSFGWAAN
jgi:hypothetical protein